MRNTATVQAGVGLGWVSVPHAKPVPYRTSDCYRQQEKQTCRRHIPSLLGFKYLAFETQSPVATDRAFCLKTVIVMTRSVTTYAGGKGHAQLSWEALGGPGKEAMGLAHGHLASHRGRDVTTAMKGAMKSQCSPGTPVFQYQHRYAAQQPFQRPSLSHAMLINVALQGCDGGGFA